MRRPTVQRAVDALCLGALLVGTWVVWTTRILAPAHRPRYMVSVDLFSYFLPAYTFEAARLRAFALPLWNPYQGGGAPFLAMLQPGALYPARLLLLATDVPTAMAWSTVGHLGLLVAGTYTLCRALGAGPAGASLGGVTFATTFGVPNMFTPSFLEAGAWLPLAALGVVRVAADPRWRWVALLGMAAAMPMLAGGYQLAVYGTYSIAIFTAAVLADPLRHGPLAGAIGRLLLAGLLALGLAAPQLLTTLAWTAETVRRAAPLSDSQIMPLYGLVSWRLSFAMRLSELSWPVAVLALVGFVSRRRFGALLGIAAIATLLVSLGPGSPWSWAYRALPGLAMFRFPSRLFTALVTLLCATGAALGVTVLGRLPGAGRRPLGALLEVLALGGAVYVLVSPVKNDAVLPWTTTDPAYFTGTRGLFPFLSRMASGARVALPDEGLDAGVNPRHGMMHRVRVLSDYEPLCSRRLAEYLYALEGRPLPGADALYPFTGAIPLAGRIARPEMLDLLAVREVVIPAAPPARDPPFTQRASFFGYRVFENSQAVPRAYLAARARFVDDEAAALALIQDARFNRHSEVVLIGRPALEEVALGEGPDAPLRAARIVTDDPERVTVEFEAERPLVLVLADAFAPGWRVAVDGAPRRLWQANHFVRAVVVRPGERQVEFTYHAPGFALGMALAAASVGALALAACWTLQRRRDAGNRGE